MRAAVARSLCAAATSAPETRSRCALRSQGRPKAQEDKYRLAPVYKRLQQLLAGVPVLYVDDCIGEKACLRLALCALRVSSRSSGLRFGR